MPLINITLKLPDAEHQMRLDLDPSRFNEAVILNFFNTGRMYEPDIAAVFNRAIQRGDTVLDIGANVGFFSVLASHLVGPAGCVVAFEPAPDNLERLARNLALNSATNVRVVDQPASNVIENVTFHLNSDNEGGHSLWDPAVHEHHERSRANPRPIGMTTTTVDAEVARLGLAPPRLIKIDTEGAEHRILQGAAGLLRTFEVPYIIAEMNEFGLAQLGSSQDGLRGFMADLGYETFLLYYDGSLPKLVPRGTRIVSKYFLNLLFSTLDDVAALWRIENHDPEVTAPDRGEPPR